jgi:hypothetical protein
LRSITSLYGIKKFLWLPKSVALAAALNDIEKPQPGIWRQIQHDTVLHGKRAGDFFFE